MKTEHILQADVLDIIFDNRNKSYGAYSLRKFYNNRLFKSLGITFLFAIGLCLFTLVKGKAAMDTLPDIDTEFLVIDANIPDKKDDKKIEKPKSESNQKEASKAVKMDNLSAPKITKSDIAPPIIDFRDEAAAGNAKVDLPTGGFQKVGELVGGKDSVSKIVNIEKPVVDKLTPNDVADVMPQYPGGMKAFRKFLEDNLTNPEEIEEGEDRMVQIRFIVGYDGQLKSFETVKDGGESFNKEVVRVLKKMPNWIPGKIGTDNVSVYYTIPVKFVTKE